MLRKSKARSRSVLIARAGASSHRTRVGRFRKNTGRHNAAERFVIQGLNLGIHRGTARRYASYDSPNWRDKVGSS